MMPKHKLNDNKMHYVPQSLKIMSENRKKKSEKTATQFEAKIRKNCFVLISQDLISCLSL